MGVPEGGTRKDDIEKYFKIKAENFPKLMKIQYE